MIETKNGALIAFLFNKENQIEQKQAIEELESLVEAAGMEVMGVSTQIKHPITAATYLGKGKIEEIRDAAAAMEVDLVIFNDELSGSQIKNISNIVGIEVIDRTALILELFSRRATTPIARLQVALAQQKYQLPRLVGSSDALSRQRSSAGGAVRSGTRGGGEQKLELDRRVIKRNIYDLEQEINQYQVTRKIQKSKREKNETPVVALVGYTNAGKSSLMNRLLIDEAGDFSDKEVFVKDMLFATLDTANRRIQLKDRQHFILTDTVGFVSKLPHSLVSAFESTLEETLDADLLLQVVDCANIDYRFQMAVTEEVLQQIGASHIPMITIYNKVDIAQSLPPHTEDSVRISAKTGKGIDRLIEKIKKMLFKDFMTTTFLIPFQEGMVASYLQDHYLCEVAYLEEGVEIKATVSPKDYKTYKQYCHE